MRASVSESIYHQTLSFDHFNRSAGASRQIQFVQSLANREHKHNLLSIWTKSRVGGQRLQSFPHRSFTTTSTNPVLWKSNDNDNHDDATKFNLLLQLQPSICKLCVVVRSFCTDWKGAFLPLFSRPGARLCVMVSLQHFHWLVCVQSLGDVLVLYSTAVYGELLGWLCGCYIRVASLYYDWYWRNHGGG